jgi:hypothetical protein
VLHHLVQSASSEYLFLFEFFGAAAASAKTKFLTSTAELFDALYARTLQFILDQVDVFLATNQDVVAQLLMVKISQQHRATMLANQVPVLESFFDQLEQKLWPCVKRLIDGNIKSLVIADARQMFGPGGVSTHTPVWVRKCRFSFDISSFSKRSESVALFGLSVFKGMPVSYMSNSQFQTSLLFYTDLPSI